MAKSLVAASRLYSLTYVIVTQIYNKCMKLHTGHLLTLTSKIKQTTDRFFVNLLRYPV
jgi:hypothetical protein